jgi:hypothetical protein
LIDPREAASAALPMLAGGDAPATLSARATEVAATGVMVVLRLAAGQILMVLDSSVMNVSSRRSKGVGTPDLGWT